MAIFFTADHHFGHARIIEHCKRPFMDADHMERRLVAAWNDVVRPSDTVYHLGDFALRGVSAYLGKLNGIICLLRGNHDAKRMAELKGFAWVKDVHLLKHSGKVVWLSHYAHQVWPNSFHGSWHLFGHSHGTLKVEPWELRMDVGVDTNPGFRPYSMDEVFARMTKAEELRASALDSWRKGQTSRS